MASRGTGYLSPNPWQLIDILLQGQSGQLWADMCEFDVTADRSVAFICGGEA